MMACDCHFKPPELCFSGAVNHSSGVLWLMRILKPFSYLIEKYKIVFKALFGHQIRFSNLPVNRLS
jgi:hypothetical protein